MSMPPRSLSLRGLSPGEAERAAREFIADIIDEAVTRFEISMQDAGLSPDEIAEALAAAPKLDPESLIPPLLRRGAH